MSRILWLAIPLILGFSIVLMAVEFGFHTIGANDTPLGGQAVACQFTPASTGTITELWAAVSNNDVVDRHLRLAVYEDSSGAPSSKLGETAELTVSAASSDQWVGATGLSIAFGSGDKHLAAFGDDADVTLSEDRPGDGSGDQMSYKSATYPTWPDPFSRDGTVDRKCSSYAVYTPSGGAGTGYPTKRFGGRK